jgi:hypothetical protein
VVSVQGLYKNPDGSKKMNHSVLPLFLSGLILLLILALPVAAESSSIASISPAVGYTGTTTTVTITGANFNESSVTVRLKMTDESNITATISSHTSTSIVCKFVLSSSKTKGAWDLVVVNEDGSEVVDTDGFTIRAPMKLTSITPTSAETNDDSVGVELVGSGLSDVSELYLYKKSYDNLSASIDDTTSTLVTGTFDLTDMTQTSYKVCVMDSFDTRKCDLTFEVMSDALGSIDITSSPSGASIYLDSDYVGTTPDTLEDLVAGSHKVSLVKAGYDDWEKLIKVTKDTTTVVEANLDTTAIATTMPTPTPVPMTEPVTERPTTVHTVTVPTPWPSATATTTQASPVGIPAIIGAVGLAIVVMRRYPR